MIKAKWIFFLFSTGLILLMPAGCKKYTISTPTVTTSEITEIQLSSAISGGTVVSDGGTVVLERGVCWSTHSAPTVDDNKTSDGSGEGSFESSIQGLTQNTDYFVRAYATNAIGTVYGTELPFTSGSPSTVKFPVSHVTYNENEGTAEIEVVLSHTQADPVTVEYTWTSEYSSSYHGDFILPTNSLTISAGELTGHIAIQIIDDTQIDYADVITLTLTSATSNAILDSDLQFVLQISDNDFTPANALQVDLTWFNGFGQDIDNVDLNLVLMQNVVYSPETGITDFGTPYRSSLAPHGFETMTISPGDTDQVYWFAVKYAAGTTNATFLLLLNGFGWVNGVASGTFNAGETNVTYYFGPWTKSGSTFSNRVGGSFAPLGDKLLSFKVYDALIK